MVKLLWLRGSEQKGRKDGFEGLGIAFILGRRRELYDRLCGHFSRTNGQNLTSYAFKAMFRLRACEWYAEAVSTQQREGARCHNPNPNPEKGTAAAQAPIRAISKLWKGQSSVATSQPQPTQPHLTRPLHKIRHQQHHQTHLKTRQISPAWDSRLLNSFDTHI